VKAHKEKMDALNAARLAAEAEAKKKKADREKLERMLAETEAAKDNAIRDLQIAREALSVAEVKIDNLENSEK